MRLLSFTRVCGTAVVLPALVVGSAIGDEFDGNVNSAASSAVVDGSITIENTGILIGDYDASTNPDGTSTIPGLFGGSGNNEINIDLDGAVTTELDTNPTGSMEIDIDFKTFSIDLSGIVIDMLGGVPGTAQPSVSMLFSTFHTANPGMIYPGGIPFEIPIGDGSTLDEATVTQTGPGVGILTATADPDIFDFTMAVPADLSVGFTIGIDGVDTPDDVPPFAVVLPLVGTVEQLDNGDIELVINVDPQQNADSYPIDGVLTPEIPFELPTLSSDTAGVLITLTPDLISSDVTYALSLIVTGTPTPCVPDLLDDGVLDIFDVFAFLDLFNAGDTAADFTGDGTLDIFDVFAFLDAFNAGCP